LIFKNLIPKIQTNSIPGTVNCPGKSILKKMKNEHYAAMGLITLAEMSIHLKLT
jgi:hypothetical protein